MSQLSIALAFIVLLCAQIVRADGGITSFSMIPSGASLGINAEELQKRRPNVVKADSPRRDGLSRSKFVEVLGGGEGKVVIWYYLVEGMLRGIHVVGDPIENRLNELVKVIEEDMELGRLAQESGEKILRLDGSMAVELTASRWKNNSGGGDVFVVLSNMDLTFIMFDPNHLSYRDFFINPSRKDKINSAGTRIKERLKEAGVNDSARGRVALMDVPFPGIFIEVELSSDAIAREKESSSKHKSNVGQDELANHKRWVMLYLGVISAGVIVFFLLKKSRS